MVESSSTTPKTTNTQTEPSQPTQEETKYNAIYGIRNEAAGPGKAPYLFNHSVNYESENDSPLTKRCRKLNPSMNIDEYSPNLPRSVSAYAMPTQPALPYIDTAMNLITKRVNFGTHETIRNGTHDLEGEDVKWLERLANEVGKTGNCTAVIESTIQAVIT